MATLGRVRWEPRPGIPSRFTSTMDDRAIATPSQEVSAATLAEMASQLDALVARFVLKHQDRSSAARQAVHSRWANRRGPPCRGGLAAVLTLSRAPAEDRPRSTDSGEVDACSSVTMAILGRTGSSCGRGLRPLPPPVPCRARDVRQPRQGVGVGLGRWTRALVTSGTRGRRSTVGIPGTGLSYTSRSHARRAAPAKAQGGAAGCLGWLALVVLLYWLWPK
jgi:hypothetical protein